MNLRKANFIQRHTVGKSKISKKSFLGRATACALYRLGSPFRYPTTEIIKSDLKSIA